MSDMIYAPDGSPILSRFAYGKTAGGVEKPVLVDADGKPVLATPAPLDINLSVAAQAANVAWHNVTHIAGMAAHDWLSSGTPLEAGEEVTILSISGIGRLLETFFKTNHSLMGEKLTLDGARMYQYMDEPEYVWNNWGDAVGKHGLTDLWIYDTSNHRFGIIRDWSTFGSFGTSCLIKAKNNDLENPQRLYYQIEYLTMASKEFSIVNPLETDTQTTRKALADKLDFPEEAVTVIYQSSWDEEKKLNIPSLSGIIHPKLSATGEKEVQSFLTQRKAK